MRKFLTLAGAAAVAIAVSLSAVTPSLADHQSDAVGAGIVGGMLGFMAGAAAASSQPHHDRYDDDGWYAHVRACEHYYRWRYDPDSDLVTDRWGREFPCDL